MDLVRIFNGKKFMWDENTYADTREVELAEKGEPLRAVAIAYVRVERGEPL